MSQDSNSKTTFVRALWGDPEVPSYAGSLRAFAALSRWRCRKPAPTHYYCWGCWNLDFLRRLGLPATLVSDNGIDHFGRPGPRNPQYGGRINYGVSLWRHKLEAIRLALDKYQAVVWLDADVQLVARQSLLQGYFDLLAGGQPLRGSLRSYRRHAAPHRPRGSAGANISIHGAALYCRDVALIRRAIEVMETRYPSHSDEVALSVVADEMTGGWTTPAAYRQAGYDLPGYDQRKRHVLPPIEPILFRNAGHR